jgi:DNA repair exonuclease SbcCD ATPase subunit
VFPEAPISAINPIPAVTVQTPNATLSPGKNRELVAQVKERLLKQAHALNNQVHRLEATDKQISDQKAAIEELTRQRDALHAMFVKAGQQLAEEQERSARETESLRREVLQLKELVGTLQAKSDADDQAIAELAGLLQAEPSISA